MDLIFEKILGFKNVAIDYDQNKLHKLELISIAKNIEGKLYNRVFSYFTPSKKEENT